MDEIALAKSSVKYAGWISMKRHVRIAAYRFEYGARINTLVIRHTTIDSESFAECSWNSTKKK